MPEAPSLTGRVVFQYFYDVGGDIDLEHVPKDKLSPIERPRARGARILAPKYREVGFEPLEVDLGSRKVDKHTVTVEGRIFPVGVIGIYISVEFRNLSFDGLVKLVGLNEGRVKVAGKEVNFDEIPLELFEGLKKTIKSAMVYPYPAFEHPETYTLILIAESEPRLDAEDFLTKFRKQTAGLLRGERDWRSLSDREAEDALKLYLSYSDEDIVVVDWYSALISGAVEYTDELVRMIEFARVQLLELKTYDRLLDLRVERAYDSLRSVFRQPRMGVTWRSRPYGELMRATRELAECRVEVTDFIEDTHNISKLTGEWYLGKLYRIASERFRIADWMGLVDKKLDRLQELYAMAMERVDVHRAMTLEFLMMLLIIAIVVLEVIMVAKGL
ncbi:MAG: hypothetical protein QMD00_03515 [Hadesarchaea archaeon]|nr:hypothetical protein [Hadesarchaea archaeon]